MATFISLMSWTEQGIKDFRATVDRAEMAKKAAEQLGGTLKEVYWTVGPYDLVAVDGASGKQVWRHSAATWDKNVTAPRTAGGGGKEDGARAEPTAQPRGQHERGNGVEPHGRGEYQ